MREIILYLINFYNSRVLNEESMNVIFGVFRSERWSSYPYERQITLCNSVSHMWDFGAKQEIDNGIQEVI